MSEVVERNAAVTGIGRSQIGRRLGRDPMALALDAVMSAIEDAGLSPGDVDGLACYPGGAVKAPAGYAGPGIREVQDGLRLELDWCASGLESPGPLGPLINACIAVGAGVATHVVCFCTVWESTAQAWSRANEPLDDEKARRRRGEVHGGRAPERSGGDSHIKPREDPGRATGALQWTLPFRAYSAASWIAMVARRHMHDHGTTREQLAQVALNDRANAALNPSAIYREPLTLDEYLGARMVSDPFGLYDCDVPADGCVAVVVSRADAAKDLRRPPLRVDAVGCALHDRPSWDQRTDLLTMAPHDAAAMLWKRSSLSPSDVDVAQLYDGFSFLTLMWLEALAFCGRGESGPFVEDGTRIARTGELPLNTCGGQLSAGRLNGHGLLHEACVQLWGEGDARQVPNDPRVAVVAAGGGPFGGCLLLRRDD